MLTPVVWIANAIDAILRPLTVLSTAAIAITAIAAPEADAPYAWSTVVNNNDLIPPGEEGDERRRFWERWRREHGVEDNVEGESEGGRS